MKNTAFSPILYLLMSSVAVAEGVIEETVVTSPPLGQGYEASIYKTVSFDKNELTHAPQTRLDEILKAVPGFGLFRRSGSLLGHPTTQGVSLRGVGPNGAGRTLVLLDGIPQNDPFGGWVSWSGISAYDVSNVDVIVGGGAGPWGNTALAGVVRLTGRATDEDQLEVSASYGSRDTIDFYGRGQVSMGRATLFVSGGYFETDGEYIIHADQRGPVDRRAASDAGWVRLGARFELTENSSLTIQGRTFDENRINGTDVAQNGTDIQEVSLHYVRFSSVDEWSLEASAHYRDQTFTSVFSSVSEGRVSENPALDQYDVPATSEGANFIFRLPLSEEVIFETGADFRHVKGHTNERFFFQNGDFLRERRAGGEQSFGGIYTEFSWLLQPGLLLVGGARLDYWKQYEGTRFEFNRGDGSTRRDDAYADRDGWVANGRLGLSYDVEENTTLTFSAYSGFRLPTLNELFRPFRVGSDIVEANEELEPERLYGLEAGVVHQQDGLTLSATYFRNWLNGGVGNVTLTTEGGFYGPLGVFVPDGGTLAQRRNIDQIIVDGIELHMGYDFEEVLNISLRYFWNNARISKSADLGALVGKRLIQTPEHQFAATATYTPDDKWRLDVTARFATSQFDNDLNSRSLGSYFSLDGRVTYRIDENVELFGVLTNITDDLIETGERSNGLVSIAAPRRFMLGVRGSF